jgi:GDP-L-fucose synthase
MDLLFSASVRALVRSGYAELLLRSRTDLNIRDQAAGRTFFAAERPEFVFLAAARDARHMFTEDEESHGG